MVPPLPCLLCLSCLGSGLPSSWKACASPAPASLVTEGQFLLPRAESVIPPPCSQKEVFAPASAERLSYGQGTGLFTTRSPAPGPGPDSQQIFGKCWVRPGERTRLLYSQLPVMSWELRGWHKSGSKVGLGAFEARPRVSLPGQATTAHPLLPCLPISLGLLKGLEWMRQTWESSQIKKNLGHRKRHMLWY